MKLKGFVLLWGALVRMVVLVPVVAVAAPKGNLASPITKDDPHEHHSLRGLDSYPSSSIFFYPCYRNLASSYAFMDHLEAKAATIDNLSVKVITIGHSYEKTQNPSKGYDMKVLKITGNGVESAGYETQKGILFITAGIHPAELAPPELVARWADYLVDSYGIDADLTSILDHTEIHLVLQSNPDGRAIHEANIFFALIDWRYQRKNTNPNNSTCPAENTLFWLPNHGVDLNRNFAFNWGLSSESGSGDPCDPNYWGPTAASESEVQAIMDYAKSVFPEGQRKLFSEGQPLQAPLEGPFEESASGVFIDAHTFGNLVNFPWVHELVPTQNQEGIEALGRKLVSFNEYLLGGPNTQIRLYGSSGGSVDWFYGYLGAVSYTLEVGNVAYGSGGDCSEFDNTEWPKNRDALVYAARVSRTPYSTPKGPDVTDIDLGSLPIRSDGELTVRVAVSDSELSPPEPDAAHLQQLVDLMASNGFEPEIYPYDTSTFATAQQSIQEIRLYIDRHPYDKNITTGNGPQPAASVAFTNTSTNETDAFWNFSIPVADLGLQEGPHILYVLAMDSSNYWGPVWAESFSVAPPNDLPVAPTPPPSPLDPVDVCGEEFNCDAGQSSGTGVSVRIITDGVCIDHCATAFAEVFLDELGWECGACPP